MQALNLSQTGLNLEQLKTICIVPTLCVGTHLQTLCVASLRDAERPKGNDNDTVVSSSDVHPLRDVAPLGCFHQHKIRFNFRFQNR